MPDRYVCRVTAWATTCKVAVHNSMHIASCFSRHCIHRVLTNLNVWYVPEAVKTRYAHLNANWLEMNNRLSKGDLPWYQANINNYVNQIDLFVLALQHYAERKMLLVVAISLAGGIGIFTLVFLLCAVYAIRWLPR